MHSNACFVTEVQWVTAALANGKCWKEMGTREVAIYPSEASWLMTGLGPNADSHLVEAGWRKRTLALDRRGVAFGPKLPFIDFRLTTALRPHLRHSRLTVFFLRVGVLRQDEGHHSEDDQDHHSRQDGSCFKTQPYNYANRCSRPDTCSRGQAFD